MDTHDTRDPMTQTRTDSTSRTERSGSDAGGRLGGGLLVGLVALACPLLCVGPLVLAALASTGVARVLRGAPWPGIAVAVLIGVALGVWGARARQARSCCPPARPVIGHHARSRQSSLEEE